MNASLWTFLNIAEPRIVAKKYAGTSNIAMKQANHVTAPDNTSKTNVTPYRMAKKLMKLAR